MGDFNGDGRDDLCGRSGGQWWVGVSSGAGFAASLWATWDQVAWQAVAAVEVVRDSDPGPLAFGDVTAIAFGTHEEPDPLWSVLKDDELTSLLLAG